MQICFPLFTQVGEMYNSYIIQENNAYNIVHVSGFDLPPRKTEPETGLKFERSQIVLTTVHVFIIL